MTSGRSMAKLEREAEVLMTFQRDLGSGREDNLRDKGVTSSVEGRGGAGGGSRLWDGLGWMGERSSLSSKAGERREPAEERRAAEKRVDLTGTEKVPEEGEEEV